ncbi:MAG: chromosome segregation protein SMC [Oscillospiraceae bacterium]|jgi:chromosome segregation protein|nr:chromosome segregation protein SMC [Oscillospiraceae bacterium]
MKLKSFEIKGFKTFPDKVTLAAQPGITAVVGPNGSGKSNIAEAIRWVLGEQNPRALRCEKRMEEVIFHGAQNREPVGFAEVSLCLDNSERRFPIDGDDAVLTRRLYRSGESEYYLGKSACRLKDIQELLMDTGLGQDGYSIIGQGMVKSIISDKSGDRRHVFDEACGVSKYRHRKEEALRKLAAAQVNLLRVCDKIEELQPQAESLKTQAEAARSFLLLRDELRGHEIAVWLDDLERVRRNFAPLRDDFRAASERHKRGEEALRGLYAREEDLALQSAAARTDAERAREEKAAYEEAVFGAGNSLAVLENEIIHCRENMARIEAELAQTGARSGGLDGQISLMRQEERDIRALITCLREEIEGLYARAREVAAASGEESAKMETLKIEEGRYTEGAALLMAERAAARGRLEGLLERALDTERELQTRGETTRLAKAEAENAAARLEEAALRAAELENAISGYTLRHNLRRAKAEECRAARGKLEMEQNTLQTRARLLAEQEKEHQGFSDAVKTVLAQSYPFVHGTLADLVKVDDKYAAAIETALGGALQNIVVDSEENAKQIIGYLKARSAGRATFLPLSSVDGKEMEPQGLGVASRMCRAEEHYAPLLRALLGRTAVAEDMDEGIALARKNGHRFRVVTLDGQLLNVGGSITGGSLARATGLLTRKNELQRLRERGAELAEALDKAKKDAAAAERELSGAEYDLQTARDEYNAAAEDAAALAAEKAHREAFLRSHMEEAEKTRREQDTITAAAAAERQTLAALEEKHAHNAAALDAVRQAMETLGHKAARLTETGRGFEAAIGERREKAAALEAAAGEKAKAIAETERLKDELSGDARARRQALEDCRAEQGRLRAEKARAEKGREEASEKHREKGETLKAIYALQERLEGERAACARQAKEQAEENARAAQETARIENKLALGEAEERQLVDKLWETYGLTFTAAQECAKPLESKQKTIRRIAELKDQIAALGNPNIGAIEAYAELSARLELLTGQHADAAGAKAELEKIIEEISEEMVAVFMENFEKISRNFQEIFEDIFDGGQACLELMAPDDPLGCDIDIKSRPPGKKLRSISLLSGGETSLTAIALYFAIFKARPAPFCLLDEIDHDLDEANIGRFAAYLSRLANENQFIVITHRRGTMEVCDMLYGVTTQEPGVSKVLSLRFEEVEKRLGIAVS